MDSHSRDDNGLSSADGKAVLLKVPSSTELIRNVIDMTNSVIETDVPFEVTPLIFSNVEVENVTNASSNQAETAHSNETADNDEATQMESTSATQLPNDNDPDIMSGHQSPNDNNPESMIGDQSVNCKNQEDTLGNQSPNDNNPETLNRVHPEHTLSRSNSVESFQQPVVDICNVDLSSCPTDMKYSLVNNIVPELGFKIPSRSYTDKRC